MHGGLGRAVRGIVGVEHQSARGWESQPEWLSGLLRISEMVAEAPRGSRRRAVIITPHPSQLVALMVAHLVVMRFQSHRLPTKWWEHVPTPKVAVRHLDGGAEMLVFRQVVAKQGDDFSLRFGTSKGTKFMLPARDVRDVVPIPPDVLPDAPQARILNLGSDRFASVTDYFGLEAVPYALGCDASVAVVGRKDETRAQLEGNRVRNAGGGTASLAALARVKELAHATSFRSRWLSADDAASGGAEEGSLLILNGGQAVTATVHDLEDHPWIAVLDRASTSLGDAVAQAEQYYFSVETRRLEVPDDVMLGKGHEVLLFEEPR